MMESNYVGQHSTAIEQVLYHLLLKVNTIVLTAMVNLLLGWSIQLLKTLLVVEIR